MSDKGLLEIVQRLAVDRDFRERFLIDPGTALADLGISADAYQALAAIMPILLAGGIGLVDAGTPDPGINSIPVSWGRG
jgi:hypothetical protein